MQEKTIAHPLKTITVYYDESKPWTLQDEQLVQAYIGVHDYEWNLQKTFEKLRTNYGQLDEKLKKVSNDLLVLQEQLDQFSRDADQAFDQVVMRNFKALDDFTERTLLMKEDIDKYHHGIEEVNRMATDNGKPFSELLNEFYGGKAWDTFSKTKLMHGKNYEVNAIDTVLFDSEQEQFKVWNAAREGNQNSHIDYFNRVVDHLNLLQAETKVQYTVWDGILKHMQWAQLIKEKEMQFNRLNLN